MKYKTLQEVFDIVVTHLLTQNQKAALNQSCRYRAGHLKCAVGCLIPDELYTTRIEGIPALYLGEDFYMLFDKDIDRPVLRHLLMQLQGIHDCYLPRHWHKELEASARNLGLAFNPPTTPTDYAKSN